MPGFALPQPQSLFLLNQTKQVLNIFQNPALHGQVFCYYMLLPSPLSGFPQAPEGLTSLI